MVKKKNNCNLQDYQIEHQTILLKKGLRTTFFEELFF